MNRDVQRLLRALTRLRDAAKCQGEDNFLGLDDDDDCDSEGFTKTGREMVRAIENADRVIKRYQGESSERR